MSLGNWVGESHGTPTCFVFVVQLCAGLQLKRISALLSLAVRPELNCSHLTVLLSKGGEEGIMLFYHD